MSDFFLSFSKLDRDTAEIVYKTLIGAGYSCFFQHKDIPPGANFVNSITSGLEEATTMLAIFSPAYFESKYARAELHAAFADDPLNEHHSILPLLIKDHEIPKLFKTLDYIDCRIATEIEIRSKLLDALGSRPSQASASADSRISETDTLGAAQMLLDDLEMAFAIFVSQCKVRDALVDAMLERDPAFKLDIYETFLERYYKKMTPEEKALHKKLRSHTVKIEKFNRRALYLVEANRSFQREIADMDKLREHLRIWLDKFDRIFEIDPSVGVLYAGVLEKKRFPAGIEVNIRRFIKEKGPDAGTWI